MQRPPCSALTDRQETGPITAGTVRRMSSLNLDDFTDLIERPDGGVRRDAEARRERQVVPPGALGRLDDLGEWLAAAQSAVPVRAIERPRVVLFAGDHGVAGLGVSARPAGSADELVRAVLDGASPVSVLARRLGVPVRVVDMALDCEPESLPDEVVRHRVRRGSGRIDVEDALTLEEAEAAFLAGVAVADEEADSGTDLVVLGDVSVGRDHRRGRADRGAVRHRRVGRHRARRAGHRRPRLDAEVRGGAGRPAAGPARARGSAAVARGGGRGGPCRDHRVPAAECRAEDSRDPRRGRVRGLCAGRAAGCLPGAGLVAGRADQR